jgi:hypothetical protein
LREKYLEHRLAQCKSEDSEPGKQDDSTEEVQEVQKGGEEEEVQQQEEGDAGDLQDSTSETVSDDMSAASKSFDQHGQCSHHNLPSKPVTKDIQRILNNGSASDEEQEEETERQEASQKTPLDHDSHMHDTQESQENMDSKSVRSRYIQIRKDQSTDAMPMPFSVKTPETMASAAHEREKSTPKNTVPTKLIKTHTSSEASINQPRFDDDNRVGGKDVFSNKKRKAAFDNELQAITTPEKTNHPAGFNVKSYGKTNGKSFQSAFKYQEQNG